MMCAWGEPVAQGAASWQEKIAGHGVIFWLVHRTIFLARRR